MNRFSRKLQEIFGEPIGSYAGSAPVGVANEVEPCLSCGMMPINGMCDCDHKVEDDTICKGCGMMVIDGACACTHATPEPSQVTASTCSCGGGMTQGKMCQCGGVYEAKGKGPTAKTAKKILRGTKTFKDKMQKVSGWAEEPAAAAAWMMHKATGKWPSEK